MHLSRFLLLLRPAPQEGRVWHGACAAPHTSAARRALVGASPSRVVTTEGFSQELAEGRSLADLVASGWRADEAEVARIARELLQVPSPPGAGLRVARGSGMIEGFWVNASCVTRVL